MLKQSFPGRVIFDHLPKTAGQAVNSWLRSMLGAGCVTMNLIGNHRELIRRYGGQYSVISAHVAFEGEALDPRYQYACCIREPIDRALSWLFFVLNNHEPGDLPKGFWSLAKQFVESEGDFEPPEELMGTLRNPYVEHFSAIDSIPAASDEEKLIKALGAIERFDVWGLYEALPEFLSDFAGLLSLPAPVAIPRKNMTSNRPEADCISAKFRQRLVALNALDLEFYRTLKENYTQVRRRRQRPSVALSHWVPYEGRAERIFIAPEFALLNVKLEGNPNQTPGSTLIFCLEFSLAQSVAELEIGIHLFDEYGCRVFGTNTTRLGQPIWLVPAGTHRLHYAIVADLPGGEYTVGFAFAERSKGAIRELAWYDHVLNFRIALEGISPSTGYTSLQTLVACFPVSERIYQPVTAAKGGVSFDSQLKELHSGEKLSLPVTLSNLSAQDWASAWGSQIYLSYRWIDKKGNVAVASGLRTALPNGILPAGDSVSVDLVIQAPDQPGRYRLCVLPNQEHSSWFDEYGFVPEVLNIDVLPSDSPRVYEANNSRLQTQVGCRHNGHLSSMGQEGFLLFGPYIALPAGNYTARFEGDFTEGDSGCWFDLVTNNATQVLVNISLSCCGRQITSIACPFTLSRPVSDLEIRLWTSAKAKLRVDRVCID